MSEYEVVRMPRDELDRALDWAAREGWNPGKNDADCFWAIDPEGFFMGVLDGEPIAYASAVCYDERFAFCGLYIVRPEHRGRGYGRALTRARLDYVGDRIVGLDGALHMRDKYKRLGYRTAHRSTRYGGRPGKAFAAPREVIPAGDVPFEHLAAFDREHFPAGRERFLRRWIDQPGGSALALVDGSELLGYGVLRPCRDGCKIGPLFAADAEVADVLLRALADEGRGGPVFLDVPEPNAAGVKLAKRHGMSATFACARMYRGGDPGLPLERVFGITTFECG